MLETTRPGSRVPVADAEGTVADVKEGGCEDAGGAAQMYEESVWDQDLDRGSEMEMELEMEGGDGAFEASAARAWASHASRVLWSTGQAASELSAMATVSCWESRAVALGIECWT